MQQILVLHGPNLNLLGTREPELYGNTTLATINDCLATQANAQGYKLSCKQTNAEHELINLVQQAAADQVAFIIINAAGFTHTSIALRDALLGVQIPFIEVHLSNIFNREEFRSKSFLADIATGVIMGFGALSYEAALFAAMKFLREQSKE